MLSGIFLGNRTKTYIVINVTCPICSSVCTLVDDEDKSISCPLCGMIFDVSTARPSETPEADSRETPTESLPSPAALPIRDALPVSRRYTPEKLLGRGGFAEVYLAHDRDLNRQVALKIPRGRYADRPEILIEARLAASLRHPGIVAVYDIVQTESGGWFVVTECIEGTTLSHLIRSGARLPVTQVARLMAKVARALHYAHKQGLVHRDIKPSNILLDKQGDPFVSDFGLAVHEDWQDQFRGDVSGTPKYMAPEQIRGHAHQFDGRTDQWAFGCVLYELLSLRQPFLGEGGTLYEAICHQAPKPLRQRSDAIPRELEEICLKCLSKNVSDRYATLQDVAEALEAWLATANSTVAAPPAPARRPRPRRVWTAIGAAVLLFVGIAAAAVSLIPQKRDYHLPLEAHAVPGRWYDLPLTLSEPRQVAFTPNAARGRWQFLQDTQTIVLDSREPGLVGLGITLAADYQFQIQMSRAQWDASANCGLFVGLKPCKLENGRDGFEFLSVGIQATAEWTRVSLGLKYLEFLRNGAHVVYGHGLRDVDVELHPVNEILLDAVVMSGQLAEVRFNGVVLPELTRLDADTRARLPNCDGEFGVSNSRGSTRFQSCRFQLLRKETAP